MFFQYQSRRTALKFLFYRQLVSSVVWSHYQALYKNKDTEKLFTTLVNTYQTTQCHKPEDQSVTVSPCSYYCFYSILFGIFILGCWRVWFPGHWFLINILLSLGDFKVGNKHHHRWSFLIWQCSEYDWPLNSFCKEWQQCWDTVANMFLGFGTP
jgi:hypothetical protein